MDKNHHSIKKLAIPHYPKDDDDDEGIPYDIVTLTDHIVADYLRISMLDIPDLSLEDFLLARRDAFILRMSKTEEGREYLHNAHRLGQTKPERQKLRETFGGVKHGK